MTRVRFAFGWPNEVTGATFWAARTTKYLQRALENIDAVVTAIMDKVSNDSGQCDRPFFIDIAQSNGAVDSSHRPVDSTVLNSPNTVRVTIITGVRQCLVCSTVEEKVKVVKVITGSEVKLFIFIEFLHICAGCSTNESLQGAQTCHIVHGSVCPHETHKETFRHSATCKPWCNFIGGECHSGE